MPPSPPEKHASLAPSLSLALFLSPHYSTDPSRFFPDNFPISRPFPSLQLGELRAERFPRGFNPLAKIGGRWGGIAPNMPNLITFPPLTGGLIIFSKDIIISRLTRLNKRPPKFTTTPGYLLSPFSPVFRLILM